jgi:hypothetical protein
VFALPLPMDLISVEIYWRKEVLGFCSYLMCLKVFENDFRMDALLQSADTYIFKRARVWLIISPSSQQPICGPGKESYEYLHN